jgi:hypothetical protein
MATKFWRGTADAVVQDTRVTINVFDAATTYKITIGGVVVSVLGTTDAQTTIDALAALLQASAHPYFSAVTWSRSGTGGSSALKGLADVAGVPFTFTATTTGGTGSFNAVADTTACSGPNFWSVPDNWSDGLVPVVGDTVIVERGPNICWGLGQSAVDLDLLIVRQSYTGRIGLRADAFATSANGEAVSPISKPEYRATYLAIESDAVDIGAHHDVGSPAGSPRIKLDLGVHLTTVTVHDTGRSPIDAGLPALRLLLVNSSSVVHVRKASGGVGIAVEDETEASTLDTVSIANAGSDTKVHVGRGVTIETWYQRGGVNVLESAGTVTSITVEGGTLQLEGPWLATTVTIEAGTIEPNNTGAGAAAITTFNIHGGAVVATKSSAPRTWTTTKWKWKDSSLDVDVSVITFTNEVELV